MKSKAKCLLSQDASCLSGGGGLPRPEQFYGVKVRVCSCWRDFLSSLAFLQWLNKCDSKTSHSRATSFAQTWNTKAAPYKDLICTIIILKWDFNHQRSHRPRARNPDLQGAHTTRGKKGALISKQCKCCEPHAHYKFAMRIKLTHVSEGVQHFLKVRRTRSHLFFEGGEFSPVVFSIRCWRSILLAEKYNLFVVTFFWGTAWRGRWICDSMTCLKW